MTITKKIKIKNMHCNNCERIIAKRVNSLEGVDHISISYAKETAEVTFDPKKTNLEQISKIISDEGYECCSIEDSHEKKIEHKQDKEYFIINKNVIGVIFGIIGLVIAGYFFLNLTEKIGLPEISQNMGYGLLFLVGLLTGFHCVAMCGGFVVSYTAKDAQEGKKSYSSHFMYGLGKTISYTVIGAAFGLLGSIIAFTPTIRGFAGIIAGLFLIIFGINMLGFNFLRFLRISSPNINIKNNKSPLIIGLLNGLMIACGPLQAIYIMAAGTGSMVEGAKLLFIFALGTLPIMLGFGFLTTLISKNLTSKILKASGLVVILLGLIMVNRGLALMGSGFDANTIINSFSDDNSNINNNQNIAQIEDGYQIIKMDVTARGWSPDTFVLKKGIPVKWIINGEEITNCNKAIQVPKLNLQFDIKKGEQIIEFTPTETGTISWSCWMGMIPGTFIVTETGQATQNEITGVAVKNTGSSCGMGGGCGGGCGGSGGGCGCGG
jgi:sulfite exporter TauE/SafE/copper chaperone CopZ